MPTYFVRLIETQDLVGIFVARSIRELALIIDECTEPGICEYQLMGSGGIMWTEPATPVPAKLPEDPDEGQTEPDPVPWHEATFTEVWWCYVYGAGSPKKWWPIFPDEPILPPPAPAQLQQTKPAQVLPLRKRRR